MERRSGAGGRLRLWILAELSRRQALIPTEILRQAHVAIDKAALLLLVVDSQAGITPLDEELARLLRSTGKPFLWR